MGEPVEVDDTPFRCTCPTTSDELVFYPLTLLPIPDAAPEITVDVECTDYGTYRVTPYPDDTEGTREGVTSMFCRPQ